MTPSTYQLHQQLFRHAAGMLAAYKNWLDKQVVENPDPVEIFRDLDDQIVKQSGRAK